MQIYNEYADWFHLLTHPRDYAEEAADYVRLIENACPEARTLLELGSGGVALFVPDGTAETFAEYADHGGHDGPDGRSLRYLEWAIDPDPADAQCEVHFACLLRDGGQVKLVHDRHVHGLFTVRQWFDALAAAGFEATRISLEPAIHEGQVAFLARRTD